MIREALRRCIDFVTQHNRITLAVMLVLTVIVVGLGVPQIPGGSQEGGTQQDFSDLEEVQKSQYIARNYAPDPSEQSNRTFRTVYITDEDGNVLSKDALLTELRYQQRVLERESVQTALHEEGFLGMSNLVATRAAGNPNASVSEQLAALRNTSPAQVEQLVGQVVAEDPRSKRLLPADHPAGSTAATDRRLLVGLDFRSAPGAVNSAEQALHDATDGFDGYYTLGAAASEEYVNHFLGEMTELVLPLALLLILIVLAFSYRDLVDVVVGMVGVVLSVGWMAGLLGWLQVQAGTAFIVPLVLVTGLSIDFGFHIFNRYREERDEEEGIREPMSHGVRLVATALVLVTVTSAIGFLSNLANPLPLIQRLGISITLGVGSAFLIFVTVVPALKISIDGLLERAGLDRRKRPLGHGKRLRPQLEKSVTLARRAAPIVLVVAVLVGSVAGLAWLGLDQENYQQPDGDIAEWKQQLPQPLGWETEPFPQRLDRVERIYQPASADRALREHILVEGDVTSPDTLHAIDEGLQQLRDRGRLLTQPSVPAVVSPTVAMQQAAQRDASFAAALRDADTDGDGIPERNVEELYDRLYALDEDVASSVIERTDGQYRSVLVTVAVDGSRADSEVIVSDVQAAADTMEGGGLTATVAGRLAVNEAVLDSLVAGILVTMGIALLAILVTMAVIFRVMHDSATLGAVVAVPIALVIAFVIGGMYLLGIPLTLLTALLMSLVVGVGVDYNIHLGDRFADELRDGKPAVEALRAAVTGTGGALLGSTLTTAGAFLTITLIPHPQLVSFGSIVVVALVTAFLVSLLVLPSLLLLWERYVDHEMATAGKGVETPVAED